MELAGLGRVLWRRRRLVAVGAFMALAIAAIAGGGSGPHGAAEARVLIDTPRSLVAAARPPGDETIATRARLLGSLLAHDRSSAAIARRAGISASDLDVVLGPLPAAPVIPTPISRDAVEMAQSSAPNELVVTLPNAQVPIVFLNATAPTSEASARIAQAGIAELADIAEPVPSAGQRAVRAEQLGPVRGGIVPGGGGGAKAMLAAVFAFAAWCVLVAAIDRIARGRPRRALPTHLRGQRRARGAAASP